MSVKKADTNITAPPTITADFNDTTPVSWIPTSHGGDIDSFTISSNITADLGLVFDNTTGAITGTPNAVNIDSGGKNYTVTAINESANSQVNVLVTIDRADQNITWQPNGDNEETNIGKPNIIKTVSGVKGGAIVSYVSDSPTVANPLAIDDSNVSIKDTEGTAKITASVAQTAFYKPANISYEIQVGSQIVDLSTQSDINITYGVALNPEWEANKTTASGTITVCNITPDIAQYGLILTSGCKIQSPAGATKTLIKKMFTIEAGNSADTNDTATLYITINKAVDSINFIDTARTVKVGDANFTYYTDDNGSGNGAITYTSSATAIAQVDNNGYVTFGNILGDVNITAVKASDGNYTSATDFYTLSVINANPTITAPAINDIDVNYTDSIAWTPAYTGSDINFTITDIDKLNDMNLSFDTTTGAITGDTNATMDPAQQFTVRVQNTSGFDEVTMSIVVRKTDQTAFAIDQTHKTLKIADTTFERQATGAVVGQTITYTTVPSVSAIADVNSTGGIDPNALGNVTVAAYSPGGLYYFDKTLEYNITVIDDTPVLTTTTDLVKDYKEAVDWDVNNTGGTIESCSIDKNVTKYGLVFDTSSCNIAGITTTANKDSFANGESFTITATNGSGQSDSKTIKLLINKINDTISFTTDSITKYESDGTYDKILDNNGTGTGAITYSLRTPADIARAKVETNGTVTLYSGFNTAQDVIVDVTKAEDGNYTKTESNYTLHILAQLPDITTSATTATGEYSDSKTWWQPVITGGDVDTYYIDGVLPNGLELNSTTGLITGTAGNITDTAGVDYILTAQNISGNSTINFNLKIDRKAQPALSFDPVGGESKKLGEDNFSKPITGVLGDGAITYEVLSGTTDVVDVNASGYVSLMGQGQETVTVKIAQGTFYKSAQHSYDIDVGDYVVDITNSTNTIDLTYNTAHTGWDVNSTGGTPTSCSITPSKATLKASYNLDFSEATCRITGTPNITANPIGEDFDITASNGETNSTKTVRIKIAKATQSTLFEFASGDRPNITVGDTNYEYNATGGDGTGAVTYESNDSTIASIVDSSRGEIDVNDQDKIGQVLITATKQGDGNYTGPVVATYVITVGHRSPDITTTANKDINHTMIESANWKATNIGGPIDTCVVTEGLPAGLSIDNTCSITGTPTVSFGPTSYTVQASTTSGFTSSLAITIEFRRIKQIGFTAGFDKNVTFSSGNTYRQQASGGQVGNVIYTIPTTVDFNITANTGELEFHKNSGSINVTATKAGNNTYLPATDSYMLTVINDIVPVVEFANVLPQNTAVLTSQILAEDNITIKWDVDISLNSAKIFSVKSTDGTYTKTYNTSTSTQVTVTNGDEVKLMFDGSDTHFPYGKELYVTIPDGAVKDDFGKNSIQTAGDGVWNFDVQSGAGPCDLDCVDNCDINWD